MKFNIKKCLIIIMDMVLGAMLITGLSIIVLNIIGYRLFVVKTPSMQEKYPVNSVIVVNNTDCENIVVGDVISFVADEHNTVVTHRVAEIHKESEEPYFITKGDSNNSNDGEKVYFKNVYGKVVFGVLYLGVIVNILGNQTVRIALIATVILIFIIILLSVINNVLRKGPGNED